MRKALTAVTITTALLSGASLVSAESMGIGASPQGTIVYSGSSAVARAVAETTDLDLRVQPFGGSTQYVPLVNSGELDFGLANVLEVNLAMEGDEIFGGRASEDLRLIGTLFPLQVGYFVREDSDYQSIADLAGATLGEGYTSQAIMRPVARAMLATGGIEDNDYDGSLVPNLPRAADDFAQGRLDAFFFGVGAGKVSEVDASVGGLRLLPMGDDIESMQAIFPQAYGATVEPGGGRAGVNEAMTAMTYDYLIFAHKDVADDIAYTVAKAIHENKEILSNTFGVFNRFDPAQMGKSQGELPYHPGAIEYFREAGIWQE